MNPEKSLPWLQLAYIVSISLTFILTLVIYPISKKVNDAKDQRAADSALRAEEAKAVAAQAQLELTQTRLDLAQVTMELAEVTKSRAISPEQSKTIVHALQEFKGQYYALSSYDDTESLNFALQIDRVLKEAGWVQVPAQLGIARMKVGGASIGKIPGGLYGGLAVIMRDEHPRDVELDFARAYGALAKVLNELGFSCAKAVDKGLDGNTPNAITIAVEQKQNTFEKARQKARRRQNRDSS